MDRRAFTTALGLGAAAALAQPVSAATLQSIASLPRLATLRLGLCKKIDDAAVEVLVSMKSLRAVYTAGTQVSEAGRKRLP
mgnify:CR=1 FL=1